MKSSCPLSPCPTGGHPLDENVNSMGLQCGQGNSLEETTREQGARREGPRIQQLWDETMILKGWSCTDGLKKLELTKESHPFARDPLSELQRRTGHPSKSFQSGLTT
ncbi:L-Amino-Acid Oxidase [Manis pentadactyla]|nr:L-Amino-Acid Oxidase [Manis pentadactyla]